MCERERERERDRITFIFWWFSIKSMYFMAFLHNGASQWWIKPLCIINSQLFKILHVKVFVIHGSESCWHAVVSLTNALYELK